MRRLFYILSALIFSTSLSAAVNLSSGEFYVREGFDVETIAVPPVGPEWVTVPAIENEYRNIRISNLKLDDLPPKKIFSFTEQRPREYTILFPFVSEEQSGDDPLTLYIPMIGINWEVYLNGNLICSELTSDKIETPRARVMKNIVIPFDSSFLNNECNYVALRIIGNPLLDDTGVNSSRPLIVDKFSKINACQQWKTFSLASLWLYFFVGIYYLFMYAIYRKDGYNFYFGAFSLAWFTYLLFRLWVGGYPTLFADTLVSLKIEVSVLYTLIPLMMALLDRLIRKKLSRSTKIIMPYTFVVILCTSFANYQQFVDILNFWLVTAIIPVVIIFVKTIAAFISDFRSNLKRFYAGRSCRCFLHTLLKTISGNMVVGIVVICISVSSIFIIKSEN